jgi:hypothetical protein
MLDGPSGNQQAFVQIVMEDVAGCALVLLAERNGDGVHD